MEVDEVDGALESLLMDVVIDLDADGLEVLGEGLEVCLGDVLLPDEAEDSVGFELAPGSGAVVGVELAEADLPALQEELPLIFLGDALEVVLLHLCLIESEVEVDVEGPDEDLVDEVGIVVEGSGFLMVDELNLDDAVLAVHRKLLGLSLLLAILEEHVDHLVLDGFLHPLDYHLPALPNLLLDSFLHMLK